jgi:hypothetical protein
MIDDPITDWIIDDRVIIESLVHSLENARQQVDDQHAEEDEQAELLNPGRHQ